MAKKPKPKTASSNIQKEPVKHLPVKKQPAYASLLINAWIFIPAIYYFKVVNDYALNLPYYDDIDGVLHFLNTYTQAGFSEKLSLLVAQHNEHRILSSRLIYVFYNALFGEINFKGLLFIANLQLVGIFLVMVYFIRKFIPRYWNIAAFVTSLCLFDISNFENANFALAGTTNYGIILHFMLSLFFYSKDKGRFLIPAVLFQALCIFSSGNGVVASACIVAFTFLSKDRRKIIAAFATAAVFSSLYFLNYTKPAAPPGTTFEIMITFFLKLTGSVINFESALAIGFCILILLFVSLPVTNKIRFKENSLPLICIMLFVLASMGTVALFRSNFKGINFYTSRYLIYPHLLLAITFIFGFIKLAEKKIRWPLSIAFIVLLLFAYRSNSKWGESGFRIQHDRLLSSEFVYPDVQRARTVTEQSCSLGIYCIQEER